MSEVKQQIDNIISIVQENATIAEQNANVANAVNLISMSNEELMQGKQLIVNAINKMGGNASVDSTLSQLAKDLRKLGMLDPEIGLTDDIPKPINLGDYISGGLGEYLKTAKSDEVTAITGGFAGTTLDEFDFPNATSASGSNMLLSCKVSNINLPKLKSTSGNSIFNGVKTQSIHLPSLSAPESQSIFMYTNASIISLPECATLKNGAFQLCETKEVLLPNLQQVQYSTFIASSIEILDVRNFNGKFNITISPCLNGCSYLIDFIIGTNVKSDWDISGIRYNPTEAYKKTSASLCYDTDLERYGQRFSRNWDKWKWCIINHMAANFEDRTGLDAFTITFGSTVLSQFDEEMIEAFTSKNWTLA